MATAKSTKTAGPANKGLRVTAKRPQFYRGGLCFGHEPRIVPLSELTAEQEELITAEGAPGGMLIVDKVDIEPAAEAAKR